MRNYSRRFLALLIALVMVVGLFPAAAFAETPAEAEPTDQTHVFTEGEEAILNDDGFAGIDEVEAAQDDRDGQGSVDAVRSVNPAAVPQGDGCEVTAVANNAEYGSVSVNGSIITATPNEGYEVTGYEVLEGTAVVTRDGNVFTVESDSDCTVQINFAPKTAAVVAYVSSGTVIGTENAYVGDSVTLPTDVTQVVNWTFIGWVTGQIDRTADKPEYLKPGASYTVNAENVTLFAVYKQVEGNGGTIYQLVTETPADWEGNYVISSAKTDGMIVMKGAAGDDGIESTGNCNAAFAVTGIVLEDDVLRDVDELYVFEVEARGSDSYSFRNASQGSYLAVFNDYLWTRANYDSSCCNWFLTCSSGGIMMKCDTSSGWPYLYCADDKFGAVGESSAAPIQLWKETDDGEVWYWTDPAVEAHEHELTEYPTQAPTCGVEGHSAYYQCSVCYKYFSDEAGENEITLSSTVIPATGEHVFSAWSSNNDGTHSHRCTVCGRVEKEDCSYDAVVTAPTATQQGYTTYTCTVCDYSYVGDYTQPLGENYTVQFIVPAACETVNDMISNTNTGIILPVVEAPEGYRFMGWVEDIYDNVETRPSAIFTGRYVAHSDVILFALFRYTTGESGATAYELVTEEPNDWEGRYLISYGMDTDLYLLAGIEPGSYETTSANGCNNYAASGVNLTEDIITDVSDRFIFQVEPRGENWSIQNIEKGSYVVDEGGTLRAAAEFSAATAIWELSMGAGSSVAIRNTGGSTYPYVNFNEGSKYFWVMTNPNEKIHMWRETEEGTPYWTTVIGEFDPGVGYTVSFTTPYGVTAPEPRMINSISGATLPTVEAPEGYRFMGWVLEDYDNVELKPDKILSGRYRPQSDVTLKALFSYFGGDGKSVYALVTENQTDWSGDYVITCNKETGSMIILRGAAGEITYESEQSDGMVQFADSGMTLEDNMLLDVDESLVFHLEDRGAGYSIQNRAMENYLGRNVTSQSQSARLWSYGEYEPAYCRWSFTYGENGSTQNRDNILIAHVNDYGLDGSYPYLGCGWFYHYNNESDSYPFFWVDGSGESYDSDVFYMYMWKETGSGTRYWTTVLPGMDYTVHFSVPRGCEQPEDMISNTDEGIILPSVTNPEGYTFLGWVESSYDNVADCPETVLTGKYVADEDVTLYALFSYLGESSGEVAYRLTDAVENGGKYIIVSEESITDNSALAVGNSVVINEHYLSPIEATIVSDDTVAVSDPARVLWEASGSPDQGFSFYNAASGKYMGLDSSEYLYPSDTPLSWLYTADRYLDNMVDSEGYYYLSYDQMMKRYTTSKEGRVIRFYQESEVFPMVYTTVIEGLMVAPVVVYFVDQDNNEAAYVYASGEGTENAPFPGVPVTALGVDENGWNFYMITLDRDVFTGVTFSGGTDETRTAELGLGEEGYIVYYVGSGNASVEADVWPGPGEEQEATCTEPGTIVYTGLLTGDVHGTEIAPLGHDYQAVVTEPTCTVAGYTTHTCSRCGESYTDEETEALGHDFGEWTETTAPTCTEAGEETRTCSRCDAIDTRPVEALGHDFGEWTETTAPTCTEAGEETRTCSRCDAVETRPVEALGHDYQAVVTEPSCTEGGYTTYTCARCGDTYTADETEALGHDYKAVVTSATCTEGGFTTYTCSRCGDSYTDEETEPLGHDFGEWAETTAPTCLDAGEETRSCSRCDAVETRPVEALGHDYQAVVTEPTCTEAGYTTHTCARCGDSYTDSETAALGHDFGEWAVTTAPSCTEAGEETRSCSRCDAFETQPVEALGHDYQAVVTEPTCTAGGYTTYTCSRCQDSYTDSETDALGHDYVYAVTVAPKVNMPGLLTGTCSRCQATTTVMLPKLTEADYDYEVTTEPTCTEAGVGTYTWKTTTYGTFSFDVTLEDLGHDYQAVVTEPTCTEGGYTTHTCSRCGDSYTDSETEALGHDFVYTVTVAPKVNMPGLLTGTCTRCQETTTVLLPKLNTEDYDYAETTAPTCTEAGAAVYTWKTTDYGTFSFDVTLEALGHDFGDWTVTTAPTCLDVGEETRSCSRCDAVETRTVEALGHDYQAVVTEPTCTEAGYTTHTCSRCGDSYTDSETEALGHDYQAVVTEPTCTESGFTTYTCSRCGDSYSADDTFVLGHAWDAGEVIAAASHQASGEMKFTCTRCGETKTEEIPKLDNPFVDVHEGDYFFDPVMWALDESVTGGVDATHFGPKQSCTREQIVTFLWAAAGRPEPETEENPFSDVKSTDYFCKAVLWAAENGVTGGVGNGKFGVGQACTRAEAMTFLWKAKGSPEPETTENPFSDVKPDKYYFKPVLWAVENGVTAGVGDGRFGVGQPCTRGEIITFLYKAFSIEE